MKIPVPEHLNSNSRPNGERTALPADRDGRAWDFAARASPLFSFPRVCRALLAGNVARLA